MSDHLLAKYQTKFIINRLKLEDFKLTGIDPELIDRIYFNTQLDKTEYLTKIESIFKKLSINIGDERIDIMNKLADENVSLEFIREILAYTGDLQYSKNSDRNNYYTNCTLCEYNIQQKISANENDFQKEELLFESIMLIDLAGYAKVSLIFNMGKAFSKLGMWEKADFYFEILRNTSFEISPATVSSFYKAIAELYLDAGKKGTSLNWLRDGLQINPKLSVKKLTKELESKL